MAPSKGSRTHLFRVVSHDKSGHARRRIIDELRAKDLDDPTILLRRDPAAKCARLAAFNARVS